MGDTQNTILMSTVIVSSLPLIATGHFLCFGWPARKAQILSRFSNDLIKHYRSTFCPGAAFTNIDEFQKEYNRRYGRRLFFFPVLLLATTLIFFSYLSTSWVLSHDWVAANDTGPAIAISSLAGAFVWVSYDLILRARQNDVVTSDINRATLRMLVSVPFGFAIAAFAGVVGSATVTSSALAFFVGAFPTDSLLKFMRRTAGSRLSLDAGEGEEGIRQLTTIPGISQPIAERLIDEGVKTILQLAYTDPIYLTIRSGMDFAFILMCCGQALVRANFEEDQMKVVERFGLRTGFEIKTLNDALIGYDEAAGRDRASPTAEQIRAVEQLQRFASELNMDPSWARFILDQIAEDPHTRFIWWMWPDTEGSNELDEPQNAELLVVTTRETLYQS